MRRGQRGSGVTFMVWRVSGIPRGIQGDPTQYFTAPSIAPSIPTGQLTAKSGLLVKAALMAHH